MEKTINNFVLKRKESNHPNSSRQRVAISDAVHVGCFQNSLEIIIRQNPPVRITEVPGIPPTDISAKNILVLNLNHPHAYGHIYSEVLSELYAVDETYPEYDCVLTRTTPLIQNIINCFNLNISNKIKFIDKSTKTYQLNFEQLEIVNHAPITYINKTKNVLALKAAFHKSRPIINTPKPFVIFCSRSISRARNGRNITEQNENDVVEHLKRYSDENHLEFYFLTGEEPDGRTTPILKQYELFSNAKIVVGPHGGVFSNLIFLDPAKKPKVIEFCPCPGKTFHKLFNGAIDTFTEYYRVPFILPPEVECGIRNTNGPAKVTKTIEMLGHVDSTIDLSEIKNLLPLTHK